MKTVRTIVMILFVLWLLWIMFSWCDILNHNDPVDGDKRYSPLNMFVVLGGAYE